MLHMICCNEYFYLLFQRTIKQGNYHLKEVYNGIIDEINQGLRRVNRIHFKFAKFYFNNEDQSIDQMVNTEHLYESNKFQEYNDQIEDQNAKLSTKATIEEIIQLLRSWVSSGDEIDDDDVNYVKEFFRKLIYEEKLDDLTKILTFFY